MDSWSKTVTMDYSGNAVVQSWWQWHVSPVGFWGKVYNALYCKPTPELYYWGKVYNALHYKPTPV
jgi:hypothetical protein